MTLSADEATRRPITTDEQVLERVDALIGKAVRRQLWLLFIDAADRQIPLVIPMADHPAAPYGGRAEMLASRIADVVEKTGAAQIIVVWERRLRATSTEADRAWARELATACADVDVRIRAQLISHRDGTRWFAPDDYL
ncbi:hypothetical protein ASF62_09735 [Leifsonia sp. Leaf325]|nr:hypothetical protein [Leifsonia sp. Leaf325]KQQ94386.1 hypothetical protein ASF62_09735 [Leifsonia sp. Leaf325]